MLSLKLRHASLQRKAAEWVLAGAALSAGAGAAGEADTSSLLIVQVEQRSSESEAVALCSL